MMKNVLVGLSVATVLVALTALATENVPGSTCVAAGSGVLNVRTNGEAENATAAAVTAVCPTTRDPSLKNFAATVWVRDRSTTAEVCCKAMSRNPAGATVTGTEVCSSGASSSYQTLSLPAINDPYTYSHFYVSCSVPPVDGSARSAILTVRVNPS
jgi:catabolite regulation protein CreA